MSWVKIDDRYATHRKIMRAGPVAMALDVAGMCYAAQHETDGHIPRDALTAVAPCIPKAKAIAAAAKLVEVDRWEAVADGWRIHDFLVYNPTAEERRAKQAQAVKRTQKWRQRRNRDASTGPQQGKGVTRQQHDRVDAAPHPHPLPSEGGDGDPPKSPHPQPSEPASPEPSPSGSDSADQTHPQPALVAIPTDPGDPPTSQVNGQVPALSAMLQANFSAALDAELGPNWRRSVPQQTGESPEEFEARRRQELARLAPLIEQEANQTRAETDQKQAKIECENRSSEDSAPHPTSGP